MEKIISPKIVSDPIRGIIDIRPVLPMVQTEAFQSLAFKNQLGVSYMIFPMATHSRMAHSYGAYGLTVELTKKWLEMKMISKEEARAVNAFALYHDIGHGPFSHVTEALSPYNNDEQGMKIITSLKKEIEDCGVNFELFQDIFSQKNPLYLAVHDKNLGMEKLDYLERDGLMTGLGRPSSVGYLVNHIYFIKGELLIDPKVIDAAKEVQDFYIKMYKNVYLRKKAMIGQRMLQKMVYALIQDGDVLINKLHEMRDFELLNKLQNSQNQIVRDLFSNFLRNHLFKETIVVRYESFANTHRVMGKPIRVFGAPIATMEKFIINDNFQEKKPEKLLAVERTIAEVAGIPQMAVLVVPVISPHRFQSKDIKIYYSNESLKAAYPIHYESMEEYGRAYASLRVCVLPEYREKLAEEKLAKKIYEKLLNFLD